MPWILESDNDTGPNDGYFREFWTISKTHPDGSITLFKANTEGEAKWLYELLNKHAP